jgi:NADP-dependent 3-hydroxy acid dehydrogenase YdfG
MLRPEDVAEAIVWVAERPAHVDIDWLRLGPAEAA